jgi:hypothetical protein
MSVRWKNPGRLLLMFALAELRVLDLARCPNLSAFNVTRALSAKKPILSTRSAPSISATNRAFAAGYNRGATSPAAGADINRNADEPQQET